MNKVKEVLPISSAVEQWKCHSCGESKDRTTANFTEFDLKRGNHECRVCHALRTWKSEHQKHEMLEKIAQEVPVEKASQYQTLNIQLAKELGYTRSSTVKRFVYEDGLAVFKYFQNGRWFLAISQADARYVLATHTKNGKEVIIQEITRIGDTDTCGLCGGKWTVRCNIHKTILENGVELFCCTRCKKVMEVCDDVGILRTIADGLEHSKKK